jgi:hypothetical protein
MNKLPDDFYPVTPTAAQKLRKANLTASEWKIWSYLIEVDPWGDRYHEVETISLLSACEVSKATYYRAIAKFQEAKIFDFQDKGFNVRNLNGIAKIKNEKVISGLRKPDSQNCENSLKIEKVVAEMRQLSQDCENQGSKVAYSNESESPQIYSYQLDQIDRSIDRDFVNFENSEKSELTQVANLLSSKIDDSGLVCNDELANVPTASIIPVDGDSFRRRVEDFIIKSRNFVPRDRIAYFSRFSKDNWHEWEAKYKATLIQPSSMYKPFGPEQVEIASPDSPSVQDAIAEIRKSLGIKT